MTTLQTTRENASSNSTTDVVFIRLFFFFFFFFSRQRFVLDNTNPLWGKEDVSQQRDKDTVGKRRR